MLNKQIIRQFRMRNNQGMPLNSSRVTRQDLDNLLRDIGFKKGVEIGVWRGDHAKRLLQTIPGLELTCIDPWSGYKWHSQEEQDGYYNLTLENLKDYSNSVKILRMNSLDALPLFEFDYCVTDIIFWTQKVKSGGIIAVHDYDSYMTGVMMAVNAYTHCHGINPWFVIRERNHPFSAFWVNP
jgi:hypothetical protein